jgi:hypothetical protein
VSIFQGSLDLSGLPEEAKKELIDFYQLLIAKYTVERLKSNAQDGKELEELLPKRIKQFTPMKRDEIYWQ